MYHCSFCGSNDGREELVDEVFKLDGHHVLVERIPARVCTRCGDKTFSRETTERIRLLLHSRSIPAKSVEMDVFEYG